MTTINQIAFIDAATIDRLERAILRANLRADILSGADVTTARSARQFAKYLEGQLRTIVKQFGLTRTAIGREIKSTKDHWYIQVKRSGAEYAYDRSGSGRTPAQFADVVKATYPEVYLHAVDALIEAHHDAAGWTK